MTINFILPFASAKPIGGFKIVYEYANRLAMKGHTVNLIHPSFTFKETFLKDTKYFLSFHLKKFGKRYRPNWFGFNKGVNVLWIRSIENQFIPDADVLVTTAWRTAKCSIHLSQSKGKKFYFIQGYEIWNGPENEVNETWRMPFKKIVISKWLNEIAGSLGESAVYIPNGLDFSEFGTDINPIERNPKSVMMPYNELKFKGSESGLKALEILKKKTGDLRIILFGVPSRPADIPEWIQYYESPDRKLLRKLYNECAIFISPSLSEGFGLISAEAMMSSCALVASNIGGHREFAIENETALTFDPGNSEMIAGKVLTLINDNDLRIRLAEAGNKFIQRFTWEKAAGSFERILLENENLN